MSHIEVPLLYSDLCDIPQVQIQLRDLARTEFATASAGPGVPTQKLAPAHREFSSSINPNGNTERAPAYCNATPRSADPTSQQVP